MGTVLLAGDDAAALRSHSVLLLEAGYEILADAVPIGEAVAAARRLRPDLVIVDAGAPTQQEREDIRQVVREQGERPVVIVTTHGALASAGLLELGAAMCVARDRDPLAVLAAAAAAAPGLDGEAGTLKAGQPGGIAHTTGAELTPREMEILYLLRAGSSTKEIAAVLGLSVRTVDFHRANIKNKLQLRSGAELIAFASRNV